MSNEDNHDLEGSIIVEKKGDQINNETAVLGSHLMDVKERQLSRSIVRIEKNQTYILPALNQSNKLQINSISSAENLLEGNNSLINILDQSNMGAFDYTSLGPNGGVSLNVTNQIYASALDLETNLSLNGNENFIFQYNDLIWDGVNRTDPSIFGYVSITFNFENSFAVTLLMDWTQTYEQLGFLTNSSEVIKLKSSKFGNMSFSLGEIANFLNKQNPSILSHIKFDVYLNEIYNFNINIANLKIMTFQEDMNLTINDDFVTSSDSINLQIEKNTEVLLSIPNWLEYSDLEIVRSIDRSYEQNVTLSYNGNMIVFQTNYQPLISLLGFQTILDFPSGIIISSTNATDYMIEFPNQIIVNMSTFDVLLVEGSFQIISNPINDPPLFLQGKAFSYKPPNLEFINSSYILHTFTGELVKLSKEFSKISGSVQERWPKGEIALVNIYQNRSQTINYFNLEFHPSELIEIPVFNLDPIQKKVIPMYFNNLTSNRIVEVEKITISQGGIKVKEFDSNKLEINPGEYLIGNNELMINATSTNLVWQILILSFEINEFEPKVDVKVGINNSSQFELILTISEIVNWSLQAYYRLTGISTNRSGLISGPVLQFFVNQTVLDSERIFYFSIYFLNIKINYTKIIDLREIIPLDDRQKNQDDIARATAPLTIGILAISAITILVYKSRNFFNSHGKIEF